MCCIHVMVVRVTRDWDSALQEAQTTLTLVKTPASSSPKSSLEEQLPRTAGSGQRAFGSHHLKPEQVALPQGCMFNAATDTPDQLLVLTKRRGSGGSSICSGQRPR